MNLKHFLRVWMLVAAAICFGAPAVADGRIENVRFGLNGDQVRVVLDSSTGIDVDEPAYAGGDRDIIAFDLTSVQWDVPFGNQQRGGGAGKGGISEFSYRAIDEQRSQLKFYVSGPMVLVKQFALPPNGDVSHHRTVFDFQPTDPVTFASLSNTYAGGPLIDTLAPIEEPVAAETKALSGGGRYVIVIDPGHGGRDPGAIAIGGTVEKEVNLLAALTLRDLLSDEPRYEVKLTRDDDTYIDLEQRVEFARQAGADLFISIHADAAGNRAVKGASVYTISDRGQRRSDSVAQTENWIIPLETEPYTDEVGDILIDLVKRETKTHSAQFAEVLIPSLARNGPVLRNTHRTANFFVLLAPDVPAVLLEMGFLTNPQDEVRLASEIGRKKLMIGVKEAIDAYFGQQEAVFAQR